MESIFFTHHDCFCTWKGLNSFKDLIQCEESRGIRVSGCLGVQLQSDAFTLHEDGSQGSLHSLGYVSKFCFYAWILPFLDEGIHYYFQLWVVTISWSLGLGVSSLHVSCLIFMSHLCWGSLGSMCFFGVLFCALCHVKQNKIKLKEEKREKKREK